MLYIYYIIYIIYIYIIYGYKYLQIPPMAAPEGGYPPTGQSQEIKVSLITITHFFGLYAFVSFRSGKTAG